MAKVPGFATAFVGRWRIVEMDVWDSDFLDLVEEAHLIFQRKSDGEIAFGALKGFVDVRHGTRDGSACADSAERLIDFRLQAVAASRAARIGPTWRYIPRNSS